MNAVFEKNEHFQIIAGRNHGFPNYPPSFHPHGELLYVIDGQITITVNGQPYLLQRGDLATLFPYQIHSYEKTLDATALLVLFDPATTVFYNTLLSQEPACCRTDGRTLYPMMDRIPTLIQMEDEKTATAYLNAVLGELLHLLVLQPRSTTRENVTLQILSWCAEHFTEDITLSSVANALYISQSYVSKIFTKKLRCSFREYINALRIHKAQDLLENSNLKILEIMTQCGFLNQGSFNRVFLEHTGLTPMQFRKQHSHGNHPSSSVSARME